MRKMIALLVSIAFSLSVAGMAAAQTPAPKPAEAPKAEQKMKKETKADCLKMAKDDAAKAECEKKYAKASKDMKKPAEKKPEEAKKP